MEINELTKRFSSTRPDQMKAIFASLFILQNRLQTVFDKGNQDITLKQFMLLIMIKQSNEQLTYTQLGELLGCSRQNIKKLAGLLEKKGFVTITASEHDARTSMITPTSTLDSYFDEVAIYHGKMLTMLFEDYTNEEMKQLFITLTKLYGGIEKLEQYLDGGK